MKYLNIIQLLCTFKAEEELVHEIHRLNILNTSEGFTVKKTNSGAVVYNKKIRRSKLNKKKSKQ